MSKKQPRSSRERSVRESLQLLRRDGQLIELGTFRDQVYSYETDAGWQYHWSIAEAQKRAEARGELTTISLTESGMTLEMVRRMNQGIDVAYAQTTDLLKPVLFVPFIDEASCALEETGGRMVHVLIDGWHRVFHALLAGVDILPCYVLTEEDAKASLIIQLPPGQGLPFEDIVNDIVEGDGRITDMQNVPVIH
ncbi:MAG: hypothetical protein EOO38_06125 [Cytophagaceae bacterium]|nr:MAG: hypothetical protein EOO38_06125 [Cytophagaceae bacterium]